ncbi:hypothetical protein [Dactylosporangium sp. CA-139066]|uniref:hypothetical protein n=1 Tax=Dactylosporangium sp. CA-139066 TaxID=3239930 RepID=UPI003D9312F3
MIVLTGAAGGVASLLDLEGPVRRTDRRATTPDIVPGDRSSCASRSAGRCGTLTIR